MPKKVKITENSTIERLTDGKYKSLRYDSSKSSDINYNGPLISEVLKLIDKTGLDVGNTNTYVTGKYFRNVIMRYQKANGLKQDGILNDDLLHHIYNKSQEMANTEIEDNDSNDTNDTGDENLEIDFEEIDPHYDPFFLNNSSKQYRQNHKDIVISLGDGAHTKTIKNVFMRSVSVQVDTSGNPISEVYNFIARDIIESDAEEDQYKYLVEDNTNNVSSSSDIKYNFNDLFKDM